jgi:peptidoglycan/xylan/chitin deacetylase (PgdA/CDA1 family)
MNKKIVLCFLVFINFQYLLANSISNNSASESNQQIILKSEVRYIESEKDTSTYTGYKLNPNPLTTAELHEKEIALTFDDGPNPVNTPLVLETLKKFGVKATFFVLGQNVKRYPDLIKKIIADGHNIANHTWSHNVFMKEVSVKDFTDQIKNTHDILVQTVGENNIEPFFRFPTGAGASSKEGLAMLSQLGFANFYWSMSAHDSRTKDPAIALNTSIAMLDQYKKGLFLCHDVRPHTASMLPAFLTELYKRGYTTIQFKTRK